MRVFRSLTLTGLGPGYESFVTTMLKPHTPSYSELIPLLESHETIKSMHSTEFYGTNHNVAFYGQRQGGKNSKSKQHNGFTSKGRGFPQTRQQNESQPHANNPNTAPTFQNGDQNNTSGGFVRSQSNEKEKGVICQICHKPNHTALRCWHRYNQLYQTGDVPQALAALHLAHNQDDAWYLDTGGSTHMTADAGKLHSLIPYTGPEKIMVGNGESLNISHIGDTTIATGNNSLPLHNVLVVPNIKKNLISVSQLTSDFLYDVTFSSCGFVIKVKGMKALIAKGSRHGDLYALQPKDGYALFSHRFRIVGDDVWH